mgnify:CR=1 FL=1|tara:strand:- start:145 stop:873 length:729 start_codon:yes stop_codon:yes gene_type:complete
MENFLNLMYFFGDAPAGDDLVGITFWLGTMAMMAASAFFFLSMSSVDAKWRSSILVSGLITFIAAVHYMYMRDAHAAGDSTTVFRYVDWILTVPLMCVEFYLILKAAGATKAHLRDLVVLSTGMLVTGYVGEAGLGNASLWGLASGICYFAIVYMIKFGALAKLAASAGGAVQSAHNTLCWFVIVGWAIYPVGYMIGTGSGMWYEFMTGWVAAENMDFIYNVGDSINKIGFGLVVYNLAVSK